MQRSLVSVLAVLCILSGCSTVPAPPPTVLSEQHRSRLGTVAVRVEYRASEQIDGIATGKGAGAAAGMGGAVGGLLDGAVASSEPGAGLVLMLALPFAVVGGALYGSVVADSAVDVQQHLGVMRKVLDGAPGVYEQQVQRQLRHLPYVIVVDDGEQPGPQQSRLTLRFHELRSEGGGPKSEIRFVLKTRTELFVGADPYPAFAREYVVGSATRRLSAWVADDGAPLRSALSDMAGETLERVIDDHFAASPYRVEPVFPARNFAFRPPRLDTLTPTFRWVLKEGALSVPVSAHEQLSYDLMVVPHSGEAVAVHGITQDRHALAQALPACERFNWRVRASYQSMGQVRRTAWSPNKQFRTPCIKKRT